jgi:hypothetical protein
VIGRWWRRFASGEKAWWPEVRQSGGASARGGWWHSASRGRGRWPSGKVGQLIGRKAEPLGRLRRKIKGKMISGHKEKLDRNDELNREASKNKFF